MGGAHIWIFRKVQLKSAKTKRAVVSFPDPTFKLDRLSNVKAGSGNETKCADAGD